MVTLPRLVIAAPASGHGKTTVATGLMAALSRAGHVVSGHKVGPDYIDPGYHALATGRSGRNLDPHLVGESLLVPLLLHGAAGADIAVVEGVMGLYDGQIGGNGFASTAHVAAVTRTPVVLVVDVSHASRSIAATVHGMTTWDPSVDVVGVILNKAGSQRHADEVLASLGTSIPVLGVLQRDDGIIAPSRHLGLVPAAERSDAAHALDRLAAQVADKIDLEAVVRLASAAPDLPDPPWDPSSVVEPVTSVVDHRKPLIAMAGGRAFTFRYAETEELLRAAGCEVVTFDPMTAAALPAATTGIYLGGGFPEVYAADLSANTPLREDLRAAIAAGVPTVAECAGLLYLCRTVRPADGPPAAMIGALGVDAVMGPRLTLSYRTAHSPADNVLTAEGQQVTGHEFHRTVLLDHQNANPAWEFATPEGPILAGFATPTVNASYLHTHWAGHPALAQRFADAAARTPRWSSQPRRSSLSRPLPTVISTRPITATPGYDLRHHGDREALDGLLDFAVNVYDDHRPGWLDDALTRSLADAHRYPDTTNAQQALAKRHHVQSEQVLPTAGASEAFGLIARLRDWRHPVVVHPQFTEPDVALTEAGHPPRHLVLDARKGYRLDPAAVPAEADLVVIGNPTNPTGVLHPRAAIEELLEPGRVVVVDEAFLEDGLESLAADPREGLIVVRSLTKLWSIPGIRAGYLLGDPDTVQQLATGQAPWSVSTTAAAAMVACSAPAAEVETLRRVEAICERRRLLVDGLDRLGIPFVAGSRAPFVLAKPGPAMREALLTRGIAVRRADTFPGLGPDWIRIAVRRQRPTQRLLDALSDISRTP
ncbi:MAG: cobyrinic acid a,c-diamide synthase [Marmoricola sp.]|nr:cobyrinic acid a,c-diamide synthase [Marmoricola sp.]